MRTIKYPLIATIALFLIVNTQYFWQVIGSWFLVVIAFLLIVFISLAFITIWQFIICINKKFKDIHLNIFTTAMAILLVLICIKPVGLINFENFESKNVLVAEIEGVASCTTTLKLKENLHFKEKCICFGIKQEKGYYSLKGDTIFFHYDAVRKKTLNHLSYAVIIKDTLSKDNVHQYLLAFMYNKRPLYMEISENRLNK